jgi:hypothetical protein
MAILRRVQWVSQERIDFVGLHQGLINFVNKLKAAQQ